MRVKQIINNPEYKPAPDGVGSGRIKPKSYADIALLILEKEVTFTDYIWPICLPSLSTEVFGISGTAAGYGLISTTSSYQHIAKFAELKTISLLECYKNSTNSGNVVSEKSFCTQQDGVSLCSGNFDLI